VVPQCCMLHPDNVLVKKVETYIC